MIELLETRRLFAVSLSGASNVGTLIGRHSFSDSLSSSNTSDVRKFTLSASGLFSASLSGLSQNADLQLIRDSNNNLVVDTGETLVTSAKTGTAAESISKSVAAGTYYVRVFKTGTLSTNYSLVLKSDYAGNSLAAARNVGTISTAALTFKDFSGSDDTADFYKFTLSATKPFTATLSGMTANLDLQSIKDANNNGIIDTGDMIGTSAKTGTASDTISKPLSAGTYFVRVFRTGTAESNYTLSLSPIGHLRIQFDYSFDKSGFFTAHPAAKDRLNDAAASFAILLDNLSAITPSATNTWKALFLNPGVNGNVPASVTNPKIAANAVLVYVGARSDLGGVELGRGGPGGFDVSGTSAFVKTVGSRGQNGADAATPTDYGPWGGTISFQSTVNWNFNSTSPTSSQNDFLTVATHELGHIFGIGTADSWQAKISGSSFTGSNSRTANGGSNPGVDPAGGHFKQGIRSTVNGKSQEVVMDPALNQGTRRAFTRLDYAGLSDIGWQVPGTAAVTTAAVATFSAVFRPTIDRSTFALHKVIDGLLA